MVRTAVLQILPGWIKERGPDDDVVLGCRGTLYRCFADYPFPESATAYERRAAESRARLALERTATYENARYISLPSLEALEFQCIHEKGLAPVLPAETKEYSGILISSNCSDSALINVDDHLCLRAVVSGFRPQDVWAKLDALDDLVSEAIDPAYHSDMGYLTSSLETLGTGLRLSVALHLPALVSAGGIMRMESLARDNGHILEGLFAPMHSESTELFRLTNESTLGQSEEEAVFSLRHLTSEFIRAEREARKALMEEARVTAEDRVYRALAIVRQARLLEFRESVWLLSALRMGVTTTLLSDLDYGAVQEVLLLSQPGHMRMQSGACDALAESVARAELLRGRFS